MDLSTYINILNSNTNFINSLKQGKVAYLDNNIISELTMLYIFINTPEITSHSTYEQFNYEIKDDYIIHDEKKYYITDLISYITTNDSIPNIIKDNTIRIEHSNNSNCKLIDFNEALKKYKQSVRNYLFIEQYVSDEISLFINNINNTFKELINSLIKTIIIEKNTVGIEEVHIKLIYGLINNLLNISNHNFTDNQLYINNSLIRVIKDNYKEEEIVALEKEAEFLIAKKNSYTNKLYHINEFRLDYSLAYSINKEIEMIDRKLQIIRTKLINLKTEPQLFNSFLFNTTMEAIKSHNFEFIDNYPDPLLMLFTTNDKNIDSLIEMHLSTFTNLFNNEQIIYILNNEENRSKKELKYYDRN